MNTADVPPTTSAAAFNPGDDVSDDGTDDDDLAFPEYLAHLTGEGNGSHDAHPGLPGKTKHLCKRPVLFVYRTVKSSH